VLHSPIEITTFVVKQIASNPFTIRIDLFPISQRVQSAFAQAVNPRENQTTQGSNSHGERAKFSTEHRAIDRLQGRRYSARQ
jgi:hypothetical protein